MPAKSYRQRLNELLQSKHWEGIYTESADGPQHARRYACCWSLKINGGYLPVGQSQGMTSQDGAREEAAKCAFNYLLSRP